MGQEKPDKEDSESDIGSDQTVHSKAKLYRDESLDDWLKRKEKKRSESVRDGDYKRNGLRVTGELKKTPLAKTSKKQKKRNASYKKATAEHYDNEENQKCFTCGSTSNLSIHHKAKRYGNIHNKETFVTLCLVGSFMDDKYPDSNHSHTGGCHGWVEANKSKARQLNLML